MAKGSREKGSSRNSINESGKKKPEYKKKNQSIEILIEITEKMKDNRRLRW